MQLFFKKPIFHWKLGMFLSTVGMKLNNEKDNMQTVLLVIHLLITCAMIGVILIQRSEGGMGLGGGNMGGLMTTRGSANLLTHTTAILVACFLATSLGLAILASHQNRPSAILDQAPQSQPETQQNP